MTGVLVPTATEGEWLAARRKGITASEIAIVMGLSPYGSPYALYHAKLGILADRDDSNTMERGRFLEPYIAQKFGELHPEFQVYGDGRQLYASAERPWQMATPDRLLAANIGYDIDPAVDDFSDVGLRTVLECKVDGGSPDWGEPGTDEIPVHYRCQALWQMHVMGVSRAHVACLRVSDWTVREYVIRHGGDCDGRSLLTFPSLACPACDDLALMIAEGADFLARIERQDAPDVDWRPATLAALRTMHPAVEDADVEVGRSLAIQYRAAVRREADAKQRKDLMTARMLAAMGSARRAIEACTDLDGTGGTVVATRSVSEPKRIDTAMLRAKHPAIAAECTKPPKPEVKLLPAKPPKEKKHVSTDRR